MNLTWNIHPWDDFPVHTQNALFDSRVAQTLCFNPGNSIVIGWPRCGSWTYKSLAKKRCWNEGGSSGKFQHFSLCLKHLLLWQQVKTSLSKKSELKIRTENPKETYWENLKHVLAKKWLKSNFLKLDNRSLYY